MIAIPATVLLVLVGRLVYIQTKLSPRLLAYAEQQQTAQRVLPARRGAILDRCSRILAASHEVPGIYADPGLIEDPSLVAAKLGAVLGMEPPALESKVAAAGERRFVWIKREADSIETAEVRCLNLKGIGVRMEPKRSYPMGTALCHVLGFAGRDNQGLEGLELLYDRWLAGEDGRQVCLMDARRRVVWQKPDARSTPHDGCNLVLTIDAAIQEVVERALAETVAEFEAESAVAIVTAPKTGDVLAMASWPVYDPNHPAAAEPDARRNRAVTDPVEPGSAFKPIPAVALLNEGLTYPEEMIFCHHGLLQLGRRLLRDAHNFGDLTMSQVVSRSSNIGMALLGQRMSPATLRDYLARFGLDERTGIDLPGENAGLLPALRQWSSYTPASISFGQELAVTPIQLITAFGAIVNQGRMMKPRIVRSILSPEGICLEQHEPEMVRQVVGSDAAEVMSSRILVETVTAGSGKRAALSKYQVLGKTGTAQVPWPDRRGYEPDAYLASFMAAAPASDPAVCVLVQVRKPNRQIGYYGSVVSAPAAGRILEWTLPYLRVPPDLPGEQRLTSVP